MAYTSSTSTASTVTYYSGGSTNTGTYTWSYSVRTLNYWAWVEGRFVHTRMPGLQNQHAVWLGRDFGIVGEGYDRTLKGHYRILNDRMEIWPEIRGDADNIAYLVMVFDRNFNNILESAKKEFDMEVVWRPDFIAEYHRYLRARDGN